MLVDLERDPFQMNPVLLGETEDEPQAVIEHLHETLTAHLTAANDPLPLPPYRQSRAGNRGVQ